MVVNGELRELQESRIEEMKNYKKLQESEEFFLRVIRIVKNPTQCLKITINVSFEFFNLGIFPPIFVLLELACQVTLLGPKFQVFKNSPNRPFFGIFNELLSTQNLNVR